MKNFSDLGLCAELVRAVTDKGYDTPSPIQAEAIPAVLKRRDVIAAAQTGTGKTAGFTLPMIQILSDMDSEKPRRGRPVRALILTPTRELAAQVHENIRTYGVHTRLKSSVVFGGVKINPQIRQLRDGVDILVATPGRLLDLCQQKACRLDEVHMLVLDEADRMLDMGFINDIRKVVKLLPKRRQNLLFSATFSKEIRSMTRELLVNPITVEVSPENTTAETVKQRAYRCDAGAKASLSIELIKEGGWDQVLVFTRTKHGANRLSKKLDQAGIQSSAIHGDKSQGARTRALQGFKDGKIRVLVATDIAARGLDIAQLPHVINYEIPNIPEDYVHRIGRTGRAGKEGEAISLVCNEERPFFTAIEKLISQRVKLSDVEGFEPQDWPNRAPTASEVQKAAAQRKAAANKARGPRRPQQSSNQKRSNQGNEKSAGQQGRRSGSSAGGQSGSKSSSPSGNGRRRSFRRRSR
jgi:ATP-dependent RNA helicase RhlE